MHEFSAACSIVDTALKVANEHKAKRVTVVNIEVGEFTFLLAEQLEFNFEIASQKTLLDGAKLKIKIVKGQIKCGKCGFIGETQIDENLPPQIAMFAPMKCPKCESSMTEIVGGKEFIITNIEAEIES